jgi:hypothetical protein
MAAAPIMTLASLTMTALAPRTWRAAADGARSAHLVDDDGQHGHAYLDTRRTSTLCGVFIYGEHVPAGDRRKCKRCLNDAAKAQTRAERERTAASAHEAQHRAATRVAAGSPRRRRELREIIARAALESTTGAQARELARIERACAFDEAISELRAQREALPSETGAGYLESVAVGAMRGALESAERRIAGLARKQAREGDV